MPDACHPQDLKLALDARAGTGESPTWCAREHVLYWIDVNEPALHRFDPSRGEDAFWKLPSQVGAFALCRSGRFLAALRTGIVRLNAGADALELLAPPPYNQLTHRFNEGKCDALGRFWVGAMCEPLGRKDGQAPAADPGPLCVFTESNGLEERNAAAVIANGLAWNPDNNLMYFADTAAQRIDAFDFDLETGDISAPRPFASFRHGKGRPDGAAIDSEGHYWCALYGAGRVARLTPDGKIEREFLLPVSQPTMCAFGGPDYSTLYVTTASDGLAPGAEPHAGGIFRFRPGFSGFPPSLFEDV